jgi:hypothetical protein
MKEKNNTLWKWLHIRLKEADYNKIHEKFEKSTDRKLSEYARKVLLNKPITVNQRNQSFDDFMTELMQLRNELNAIGNNFNQVVKTLHQMRELPEIKTWLLLNENSKKILLQKVEEIRLKIYQINDQWLR